jgi:hypothetical protein
MPKERNKADSYREKAYEGDTKAMNRSTLVACYQRDARTLGSAMSVALAYRRMSAKG